MRGASAAYRTKLTGRERTARQRRRRAVRLSERLGLNFSDAKVLRHFRRLIAPVWCGILAPQLVGEPPLGFRTGVVVSTLTLSGNDEKNELLGASDHHQ